MRTTIIIAALIISLAISDFQPFPATKAWPITILVILMVIWDLAVDVFKK